MDYYFKIKNELINNEINKRVKDYSKNKNDIKTYYNVGKILKTADKKYGDGIIREYSRINGRSRKRFYYYSINAYEKILHINRKTCDGVATFEL